MKVLLDTHIILWAINDNPKLSAEARGIILDKDNDIFYSVASMWETAIKYKAKPDKIKISGSRLADYCNNMDYGIIPITDKHIRALDTLVYHGENQAHKDPFDMIMISQAKAEGMYFMTHDSKLPAYEEACVLYV